VRTLALALSVVALLMAGTARPAAAAENPIGAHSMLQLDDPPSFMDAMFAQAAAMHASAIRLDVAPALVFGGRSQPPDFSGLDEVASLAQTYHLRLIGDLLTVPAWMADCATPTNDPSRCATDDLTGYASAITQIVGRADPVIRDWEVWNEPDTAEFFDGTPQQYALMLRTAHDAIKAVDPADNVLLGGVSGTSGTDWLTQVFATPGADAVHAFDTANLHERGDLWQLAADVSGFRRFLAASGFSGPLWVTEHGYPADPQYQYDPGYTAGEAAQASYLAASLPTLVDAGAAAVFVTERDNLGGAFASEGVLGGDVADPPPADPDIVRKPAFDVVRAIADCFTALGRDCHDAPATASPSTALLPPAAPGQTSTTSLTVTDPGAEPIVLGAATVIGPSAAGLSVASNGCAGQILEPHETCAVTVQFTPAAGGDVAGHLELSSEDGTLDVPLIASAPSLSALRSPELPYPQFIPTGAGDGVGYPQRWRLMLTNPFSARVSIARATLSGADARRFRITLDHCAHATLRPHGACRLTVMFAPTRAGTARAQLTLAGTGIPLTSPLRPVAFALPAVTRLTVVTGRGCAAASGGEVVWVMTSQPAAVRWALTRARTNGRPACRGGPRSGGDVPVATGTASTSRRLTRAAGRPGYAAQWALDAGSAPLSPGAYVLTASAVDEHGVGPARSIAVRVGAPGPRRRLAIIPGLVRPRPRERS
jgi:hypothetical protein